MLDFRGLNFLLFGFWRDVTHLLFLIWGDVAFLKLYPIVLLIYIFLLEHIGVRSGIIVDIVSGTWMRILPTISADNWDTLDVLIVWIE